MALIGSRIAARCASLVLIAGFATAQVRVVTTIPDFADIATRVGGEAVLVSSLTKGHEDLHLVRIRPSLLVKLRKADVFVQLGLDGEHSWVPAMMATARNNRIRPGAPGFCNASVGVKPLEVPEHTTRGAGPDLHPHGNPHYNLDPSRMLIAARNIRDCLIRVDPDHKTQFEENFDAWERELDSHLTKWHKRLAPLRGAAFIEAHSSWVYFASSFGLSIVGKLEPMPGMSPTADHLAKLIRQGKKQRIGIVVGRAGFTDVGKRVASGIGAKFIHLPITSSTHGELKGWFSFMDHVVETFATHLIPAERPNPPEGSKPKSGKGSKSLLRETHRTHPEGAARQCPRP